MHRYHRKAAVLRRHQAGHNGILSPCPAIDKHDALIVAKLTKGGSGSILSSRRGDDDNLPGVGVFQEGRNTGGENGGPAKFAKLLFETAAHSPATASGDHHDGEARGG